MLSHANSLRTKCLITGEFVSNQQEEELENLKKELLSKVIETYEDFSLCGQNPFQIYKDRLLLWFNVDKTTKIVMEQIN